MSLSPSKAFQKILLPLEDPGNEDYEACDSNALAFLHEGGFFTQQDKHNPTYTTYCPYAIYFKLFAGGYRNWQISYNYTHIRSKFKFAYIRLDEEQKKFAPLPDSHNLPNEVFDCLSTMLEAYTWCENSFINNDPFALVKWAGRAIRAEKKGLAILNDPALELKDTTHKRIRDWLKKYFEKNLHLHRGLRVCASRYKILMKKRFIPPKVFGKSTKLAGCYLNELSKESIELASELNAHIRHITKHYHHVRGLEPRTKKFTGRRPSFLRVTKGKLVLAMSARCDEETARIILENVPILDPFRDRDSTENSKSGALNIFKDQLSENFNKYWGINIPKSSFSPSVIQDIFQTSFGKPLLEGLQIDLGDVNVWFLDRPEGNPFTFNTQAVLSALGVCTVYFTLDIQDNEKRENTGLSIEEIRALQSLICPHAGQTGLQLVMPQESLSSVGCNFEYLKRIDLAGIRADLLDILSYLDAPRDFSENRDELKNTVNKTLVSIDDIIHHWLTQQESGLEEIQQTQMSMGNVVGKIDQRSENVQIKDISGVGEAVSLSEQLFTNVKNLRGKISEFMSEEFFKKKSASLGKHCDDLRYLRRLAERHLHGIEATFGPIYDKQYDKLPEFQQHLGWKLSPDTGWYSYVYARSIGEFNQQQRLIREISNFENIKDHPDTRGFLFESREARASFDDWRFMKLEGMPIVPNLAHIRSHRTDAFFASNYQAFMFFPDDPQFLTDQYEKSIELMIRLDTALTGYSSLASELETEIVRNLGESATIEHSQRFRQYLEHIQTLKLKANRIQHLVANAGVSRYKDHGDFMKAFADRMGFKQLCDLMDGQLNQLDTYSHRFHRKLEEKIKKEQAREERLQTLVLGSLTLILTTGSIPAICDAFGLSPTPKAWITGIALCGLLYLFIWKFVWQRWPQESEQPDKWIRSTKNDMMLPPKKRSVP